jgi:hypothetical protein
VVVRPQQLKEFRALAEQGLDLDGDAVETDLAPHWSKPKSLSQVQLSSLVLEGQLY